jgi:hypothetical protein
VGLARVPFLHGTHAIYQSEPENYYASGWLQQLSYSSTSGCLTRQGAIKLRQPLIDAGLVRRLGTRKTGRYVLRT